MVLKITIIMSNIDNEDIIIIIGSILITLLFIICIKYIKCIKCNKSKQNEFHNISQALNNSNITTIGYNERTRLI